MSDIQRKQGMHLMMTIGLLNTLTRLLDFDIQGSQGCCLICPGGSKYMRLNHLRAHIKTKGHQDAQARVVQVEAVARAQGPTLARTGGRVHGSAGNGKGVTSVPEEQPPVGTAGDSDWPNDVELEWEQTTSDAGGTLPEPGSQLRPQDVLTQVMRDAFEGRLDFTAGKEFSDHDAALSSLNQALSGSDLFERFLPTFDDSEACIPDDSDNEPGASSGLCFTEVFSGSLLSALAPSP